MARHPASEFELAVEERQRRWALDHGIPLVDSGHTASVDENLFQPLNPASLAEFSRGAGGELSSANGPAGLQALRSSAALCVNTFDVWRDRPLEPLVAALDAPAATRLRFEARFPTALSGTPPHLDLALEGDPSGHTTAIEAKFLEPFGYPKNRFAESYFRNADMWAALPNLHRVAVDLANEQDVFHRLGAAQLIKHALGLTRQCGVDQFELVYLYYDADHPACVAHRSEIERFGEVAQLDIAFRPVSYRQLWYKLRSAEPDSGHLRYLDERYGP